MPVHCSTMLLISMNITPKHIDCTNSSHIGHVSLDQGCDTAVIEREENPLTPLQKM